jgi:glutamine amidotransferase
MITIIDYGMGNLGSVQNVINRLGYSSKITSDKREIELAEKIILPGVGSFDNGMENLEKLDLLDVLEYKVIKEKTPVLGICLGMQLFSLESEEGVKKGLGWIKEKTIKFRLEDKNLKVPHIGWNYLNVKKNTHILRGIPETGRFYFVHSYYIPESEYTVATTNYGSVFSSVIQKENIIGVQFHPEKSQNEGRALLKNFLEM